MATICVKYSYPECVSGGDGSLTHVPIVAGISSQPPDLAVLATRPNIHVEGPDTVTVHVGPEAETEGAPSLVPSAREVFAHEQRLVPRSAGVARVNVGECSGHSVGRKAGVVPLRSSVGIVASATLHTRDVYKILFSIHRWSSQTKIDEMQTKLCDDDELKVAI